MLIGHIYVGAWLTSPFADESVVIEFPVDTGAAFMTIPALTHRESANAFILKRSTSALSKCISSDTMVFSPSLFMTAR